MKNMKRHLIITILILIIWNSFLFCDDSSVINPKDYSSPKYGKYYDHTHYRFLYSTSARMPERKIWVISDCNIFCFFVDHGFKENIAISFSTALSMFGSTFLGVSIKYRFYSLNKIDITTMGKFQYFAEGEYMQEGPKDGLYSYTQKLLISYGSVDHYLGGSIGINPTVVKEANYLETDYSTEYPVVYNLGVNLRFMKYFKFMFEILNERTLNDSYISFSNHEYRHAYCIGIRFFSKRFMLECGSLQYLEIGNTDENSFPFLNFSVFFHKK